jgi:hypothetical protein
LKGLLAGVPYPTPTVIYVIGSISVNTFLLQKVNIQLALWIKTDTETCPAAAEPPFGFCRASLGMTAPYPTASFRPLSDGKKSSCAKPCLLFCVLK